MKALRLSSVWIFLGPAIILFSAVIIALAFPLDNALAFGITADLTLTAPFVYFCLIYGRNIPKTTVAPVLIIGLIIGTLVLPQEHQMYLNGIKKWLLPLIEILVLIVIVSKLYQARKIYKASPQTDFYSRLLAVTQTLFPARISYFMAAELSIPYYCLGSWRPLKLEAHQFSYHKKNGSITLLWGLILLLVVETIAFHFLLALWREWIAWIVTILSVYTCLQVLSLIRSMAKRPLEIHGQKLWLKYGTLGEAEVSLANIKQVSNYNKTKPIEGAIYLSPLGDMEYPNLCLEFETPIIVRGALGRQKEAKHLLLFVDEWQAFRTRIEHSKQEQSNE
ncbi:hypothetical protein [Aureispira anguillae]|uniref:Uncharacterized protein n=1 Tax=Aureispira anguillae TaxID=2864201 RepID=A0A916DX31_9BACT|nr:hypothetical protein [Aureispira anguillae]BDS15447.1 hypothetical protein AsAng_0062310 [Aureispira anguillae]